MRLIRAEWLKIRTTKLWLAMLVGAVGLAALSVVGNILGGGRNGRAGEIALGSIEGIQNVIRSTAAGSVFVIVLGITVICGEYRHNTITWTFLTTPRRWRVVVAKLAVMMLVGLAFAFVAAIVTLAIALPWLSAKRIHIHLGSRPILLTLLGSFLSTALSGPLGVSVGALIRNQVAAVVSTLSFLLVVENIVIALLPSVGRWLPGGASTSLERGTQPQVHLLSQLPGGLLLVAYVVVFAAAAMALVLRRDVT